MAKIPKFNLTGTVCILASTCSSLGTYYSWSANMSESSKPSTKVTVSDYYKYISKGFELYDEQNQTKITGKLSNSKG